MRRASLLHAGFGLLNSEQASLFSMRVWYPYIFSKFLAHLLEVIRWTHLRTKSYFPYLVSHKSTLQIGPKTTPNDMYAEESLLIFIRVIFGCLAGKSYFHSRQSFPYGLHLQRPSPSTLGSFYLVSQSFSCTNICFP